jgi:cell division protein FtsQ
MSRLKPPPRALPAPDRPSRWKLLLRRQRRRVRHLVVIFLLLVIAGGLSIVGRRVVSHAGAATVRGAFGAITATAGLRVRHVVYDGQKNTPQAALDAALGVRPGEPLLGFSVADARARLEAIAWVQRATVERRFPDVVYVSLVERNPFAIWQNQGKFSLIDHEGRPVPDGDVGAFGQLPLVVGAGAPEAAAALLDVLAQYPVLKTHVVAAVRVGERRWNLHLTNGGDVMLPEGAVPAALKRLADLQTAHALLDRPLQVVDLRLPDRLMLRPQTLLPAAEPKGAGG